MKPSELARGQDVLTLAKTLLGDDVDLRTHGVLHTCSTEREGRVIRIGAHAPKSAHDFFLLQLARASVEAIVTTGKILRDEPALRYALEGEGSMPDALHAYRREIADHRAPARLYVLTRGEGLSLEHPAFHGWTKPVLALPSAALPIAREACARGIEVLAGVEGLRALVGTLAKRARGISVEAGPTSARALYEAPPRVDTLWRSRFEGELDARAKGEPFVDDTTLRSALGDPRHEARLVEPSGPWRFTRYER